MKAFEAVGEWWLPNDEGNAKFGTLSFSTKDGVRLELLGSFSEPFDSEFTHCPVIFGVSKEGDFITLAACREVSLSMSYQGIPVKRLKCDTAFVGHQHFEPSQTKFVKISVDYSHLADWLGPVAIQSHHVLNNEERIGYQFIISAPAPVVASITNATLTFGQGFDANETMTGIQADRKAQLTVGHTAELALDEWLRLFVRPLQNFLSLASDHPNAISDLWVYSRTEGEESRKRSPPSRPIQVLFQPTYSKDYGVDPLTNREMLFSITDLEIPLDEVIQRWLEISTTLSTVCDLYFNTHYNPARYIEARFLGVAQAVELYHRIRNDATVLPKVEFRRMKKEILSSVPEEHRDWLIRQLEHSNEPRLLQRVSDLWELTKDIMEQLYKDKETFVQAVKDARNYYTHYNPHLKDKIAKGEELYWLTEALLHMLARCFLHELGFSSEKCLELFNKNRSYQHTKKQIEHYSG